MVVARCLLLCLWVPSRTTGCDATQQLSLTRKLSGHTAACKTIFFHFLAVNEVSPRREVCGAAVHQLSYEHPTDLLIFHGCAQLDTVNHPVCTVQLATNHQRDDGLYFRPSTLRPPHPARGVAAAEIQAAVDQAWLE